MNERERYRFANEILPHWEDALDTFFTAVDKKRREYDVSHEDIWLVLQAGYGRDVADNWDTWFGECNE